MSESPKIYARMAAVMSDIGAIGKDSVNKQQNFNFRGIDSVYNELHDVMAKHSVFSLPEVLKDRSEERQTSKGGNLIYRILQIKYTFYTDDGSSVSCVVIGEGMDSGDKASNKAMAIAHKYALLQTFCIPTEEQKDPDAYSHEVAARPAAPKLITEQQALDIAMEISALFGSEIEAREYTKRIVEHYTINTLLELNTAQYTQVVKQITAKKQAKVGVK